MRFQSRAPAKYTQHQNATHHGSCRPVQCPFGAQQCLRNALLGGCRAVLVGGWGLAPSCWPCGTVLKLLPGHTSQGEQRVWLCELAVVGILD